MERNHPTLSIVTPSLNQGEYLEKTIQSVLEQGYGGLEYIVIDGGSNDGSQEIIRSYQEHLAFWVSEPDSGQYNAINKGFSKSTGEVMAWLNSSDIYCPWTLKVVADIFRQLPEVEWLTSGYPLRWDSDSRAVDCRQVPGFSRNSFLDGRHLSGMPGFLYPIQQESTFWRRSLWERTGSILSEEHSLAGDFELWARFFSVAELYTVTTPLGGFRRHENQKSRDLGDYWKDARSVLGDEEVDGFTRAAMSTLNIPGPRRRRLSKTVFRAGANLAQTFGRGQSSTYRFPTVIASRAAGPTRWSVRRVKKTFPRAGTNRAP